MSCAIAGIATCLAGQSLAQGVMPAAPKQVADPNAALVYWPAWSQITPDLGEKLRAIDWAKVGASTGESALPQPYRDAAAMDTLFTVTDELVRASKFARCDFEIRYDDGFMALLPHLGKAREGARLLRLAAHERLVQGNPDAAVAYIGAMVRGAAQIAGDRVLISSLVGFVMGTAACEEATTILESGRLTAAGRDEMLAALRSLDTPDPMNIRATLAFEGEVIPGYLARTYRGPKSGDEVASLLRALNVPGPGSEKAFDQIAALDEAGLKAQLDLVRKVYAETFTAWDLDGDASKLRALTERTAAGEFGPLAAILCPSLERAFGSAQKFRSTLRATVVAVERYAPREK